MYLIGILTKLIWHDYREYNVDEHVIVRKGEEELPAVVSLEEKTLEFYIHIALMLNICVMLVKSWTEKCSEFPDGNCVL